MPTLPDWAALWNDLAGLNDRWRDARASGEDSWGLLARSYSDEVAQRWSKPDSSRDFFLSRLKAAPGGSLLDIGAGTGAWAALAAPYVEYVTAVERSPGMIEVMRANLESAGVSNVRILQQSWPDVEVGPHQFSLCSHAMYGAHDLPCFLSRMIEVTEQTCFLLIRSPAIDGLMAEFARLVLGHPHDSPNFTIAYNLLLEMGVRANVLFEDNGLWRAWRHDSLEEALADVKNRLGLKQDSRYDEVISRRLAEELEFRDGHWVWPQTVRTALIYWDVE